MYNPFLFNPANLDKGRILMKPLWLVLGVLFVVAIAVQALSKARKSKITGLDARWPLEAKRHVLTERERALFRRLRETLPNTSCLPRFS